MNTKNFNYTVKGMQSSWLNKNAQFVEVREKFYFLILNAHFVMEQVNFLKPLTAI